MYLSVEIVTDNPTSGEISIPQLVSVAEQNGLSLTWSQPQYFKAVVGGAAGPAMAGPLFLPEMVLAGPHFWQKTFLTGPFSHVSSRPS